MAGQTFHHCNLGKSEPAGIQRAVAQQQLLLFLKMHFSYPRVSVSCFLWQGISNDPKVYFLLSVTGGLYRMERGFAVMVPDKDCKKCFAHFHRSRIGFQPPIIFLVICNKASQLNGQSSILLEIQQLCLLLYMVGCDSRFFF